MPHVTETTRALRRSKYVSLRIGGRSVREAAAEMGVSQSTCYEWEGEPEVRDQLRAAAAAQVHGAAAKAASAADECVDALLGIVRKGSSDVAAMEAVRANACKALLGYASGTSGSAEIEAELSRLEQELAALAGPGLPQ